MNASPPNPFSTRRVVSLVIIAVLGGLKIALSLYEGHQIKRYNGWETSEPVRMAVDLSRPGVYETSLIQTCPKADIELFLHYQGFYVEPNHLLAGLRVQYEVVDADGVAVVAGIDPTRNSSTPRGVYAPHSYYENRHGISLVELPPFPSGTYTLRVTVINRAPVLTGKAQTIVSRYLLFRSGVYYPKSMYASYASPLFIVVTCILLLIESVSRRRHQSSAAAPSDPAS